MHDDKEFMITFDCSVSINNMIYDALSMCSCFITISITFCGAGMHPSLSPSYFMMVGVITITLKIFYSSLSRENISWLGRKERMGAVSTLGQYH